ncbi:MAG: sulfate adenylyltransferase [Acidobacteriota bacterium]|nr:sulfate adenylyltransferase [Acidobacteriota bacterium]
MSQPIAPHGGMLKPLLVTGAERAELAARARSLPEVRLSSRETSDLIMLASGAFSPLDGFMTRRDYDGVVEEMRLADGTLWPMPITCAAPSDQAAALRIGGEVALVDDESDELMGVLRVDEKYAYDKRREARLVFRTEDEKHPGVAKLYAQPDTLLGGPVRVLSEGPYPALYGEAYARPAETRALFAAKGWSTVAAFQTRNPIHRSHEYCTKIALEICDGVLIHPLVGKLKADDIPAEVRMKCYQVLLDGYYPKERVALKVYPMEMRYGGPREAVLHALFRQNYGCTHIIIGRDHAGVGSYYGPFDAQKIFEGIPAGALLIKTLNIDWTFWCFKCGGMASTKTCPHPPADRLMISGTKLREMLAAGELPPAEFSRPEVLKILMEYYKSIA